MLLLMPTTQQCDIINKKLSWCWQTHTTNLADSQGHQTQYHSMLGIVSSFLLCNTYFIFNTRCFYDIRLQKCHDLENWVRSPSRSLEMSPCNRVHMTSYWRSVVTVALSRVVSEILSKNVMTLKSGSKVTQGHWKWYHSIDVMVSY